MIVNVGLKRTQLTLAQRVSSILRKYGTDAHVYLPGIGVINGLTAGNYLDSAGTTAATVDNPVGLVLDGAGSVGAELVTNGSFDTDVTGWTASASATISWQSGKIRVTKATTSGYPIAFQTVSLTSGKAYRLSCTVTNPFSRNVHVSFYWIPNNIGAVSGQVQTIIYATGTSTRVEFGIFDTGGVVNDYLEFDNISVKEVTGIHAIQATTANKPILRRGVVNVILQSKTFSSASWTKANVTLSENQSDSSGGTTATKLIETAVNNTHNISQSYTSPVGTYTIAAILKAGERTKAVVAMSDLSTGDAGIRVNLATGTLESAGLAAGSWTNISSSITALSNGYYLVKVTGTRGAGTSLSGRVGLVNDSNATVYLGDITKGLFVEEVGVFSGSFSDTDIPTTTTAPASSPTGNYWWQFDSTDVLTATFPAGYESATTIDARTTGQVTLTAQNIVGTYNIGPSIDTYGRFIFRTGLSASELTTMQTFANRLAGV